MMARALLLSWPLMSRLSFLLVFAPLTALAQATATEPLVIQVSGVRDLAIYATTCSTTLQAKWYSALTQTACDPMKLWATTGECGDAPGNDDVRYSDVPAATLTSGSGDFSIKVSALPGFKDVTRPCGGGPYEIQHKI